MKLSMAMLACVTAMGCASISKGGDDDGGGGDGSGSGSGSGSIPLSAEGTYELHSSFDLATNAPGTVGTVINEFISATDDPDDPTKYIVDKLIGALPNGTIKSALQNAAPFVTGYLNDRLLDVAPDFVTRVLDVGDKFGQVAKHFGTIETLTVGADGKAVHVVTGVHFVVDQVALDYAFHDYSLPDIKVDGVQVTLDKTGKLTIANHDVAMQYGTVLRLALDEAIIPLIDPSAQNLSDILHGAVDCHMVGQYVYDALGFGSPSTFESACNSGLSGAATLVYSEIDHINGSALDFGIAGTAKGIDKNHDGKLDDIQTGAWTGTLGYAGTPAPLGAATFFGSRM